MAITPEVKSIIDSKIAAVTKTRRTGLSHVNFLDDYGFLIASTERNITTLVNAGFDDSQLPYFRGCLELLAMTISDRTSADPSSSEKYDTYTRLALAVAEYRVELGVVGRSIAKSCNNPKIVKKYRQIMKGTGDVDNALDILGLTSIVKQYAEFAGKIRPAGKVIDTAYCEEANKKALELLQLKGYVIVNGVPQNSGNDYLSRLVTLCLENQGIMKEFAQAAYCKDPDFYNANFTSRYRRSDSSDSEELDDTGTTDPANAAAVATAVS